jgi:hypothetical protein
MVVVDTYDAPGVEKYTGFCITTESAVSRTPNKQFLRIQVCITLFFSRVGEDEGSASNFK